MNQNDEKIIAIIERQIDSSVHLEDTLIDDLGMDELDGVELVLALEEEFDIEIWDPEWSNVRTVADVIKVVNDKLGA